MHSISERPKGVRSRRLCRDIQENHRTTEGGGQIIHSQCKKGKLQITNQTLLSPILKMHVKGELKAILVHYAETP